MVILQQKGSKMSQNITVQHTPSKPVFPLNIGAGIKSVFPGFNFGDFAVIHGLSSVSSLTSMLCVQAQLPTQLGGIEGTVIFIDGGNTFNLYKVTKIAQMYKLNPKKVLENIYLSRAFTAYQVNSLITQQLKETIKKLNAKLVIVSDISGFYLDTEIPDAEVQAIFNQTIEFLSDFAKENQIIIITTYSPHMETERNSLLQKGCFTKANIVLSLNKTGCTRKLTIEKHPYHQLGVSEIPNVECTLTNFSEVNA